MIVTRRDRSTLHAYEVSALLHIWNLHGEAGLPETVVAGYDAGLLDFPSPLLGRHEPEFIEVFSRNGLQIASHGYYIVRDEHGVWHSVKRETFRKEYEIVTTNRKKARA